jgi:hypothetical protein
MCIWIVIEITQIPHNISQALIGWTMDYTMVLLVIFFNNLTLKLTVPFEINLI